LRFVSFGSRRSAELEEEFPWFSFQPRKPTFSRTKVDINVAVFNATMDAAGQAVVGDADTIR